MSSTVLYSTVAYKDQQEQCMDCAAIYCFCLVTTLYAVCDRNVHNDDGVECIGYVIGKWETHKWLHNTAHQNTRNFDNSDARLLSQGYTHTLNKVYIECTRILLLVRAVCHRDMFRPLYAIIIKQFVINITKGEHKTQHNVSLTKNSRFVPRVFHIKLELDTQIQTHKELRICKTLRVCMSVCCHGTVHPRTHHERPDGE